MELKDSLSQYTIKSNLIVLNCAILGANEIELWNTFYDNVKNTHNIIFFTTNTHHHLKIPNTIKISYGINDFTLFDDLQKFDKFPFLHEIAEYDKIWEAFDSENSYQKALSWHIYWLLILKLYTPVGIYIWNGYHIPEVALSKITDDFGIEKFYVERGPFANTFACDSTGINYNSSFVNEYINFETVTNSNRVTDFSNLYIKRTISNWSQPTQYKTKIEFFDKYNIPKDKLVIFFPSQVDRDSNSKIFAPHYASVFEAYADIVKTLANHKSEVFLLAKKHPMQETEQDFIDLKFSHGKWIEDAHIFDCIKYADAIISINSSAAVEASIYRKPILLLGNSILEHNSKILKISSRDDLQLKISKLISSAKKNINNTDYSYLSKLLFGYLYTPLPEYEAMGVKSIKSFPIPNHSSKKKPHYLSELEEMALTKLSSKLAENNPPHNTKQDINFYQWVSYIKTIPRKFIDLVKKIQY